MEVTLNLADFLNDADESDSDDDNAPAQRESELAFRLQRLYPSMKHKMVRERRRAAKQKSLSLGH